MHIGNIELARTAHKGGLLHHYERGDGPATDLFMQVSLQRGLRTSHRARSKQRGGAGGYLPEHIYRVILEHYGYRCAYCELRPAASPLSPTGAIFPDHVVPVSRGGPHRYWNVVPACFLCNAQKGKKSASKFLAEKVDMQLPEAFARKHGELLVVLEAIHG